VSGGNVMPEWLTRRDQQNGGWTVENGPPLRGEAWTNISERRMKVPVGGDETNRVIRAHEMTHAKVSPVALVGTELGISQESIIAAEEFRVNTLVKYAGFDLDALVDGSERTAGERMAGYGDVPGLVRSVAATAGGKACKQLLNGVRSVDRNLGASLREIEKALIKRWTKDVKDNGRSESRAASRWGSTATRENGYTAGFRDVTIPIAELLDSLIKELVEGKEDADKEEGRDPYDPERTRTMLSSKAGQWGALLWEERPLSKQIRGALGKTRTATNMGVNPRRMTRMLTDPQRRVFDRTRRHVGGVVLIDQSGSMNLSGEQIEAIMLAAPGCTIVGYSHLPGSTGTPNAWVLAKGGRRTENTETYNMGNGVDGPILRWAVETARKGEPIVWVCDGVVTSKDDEMCHNLEDECARIVRRHKVIMVGDAPEAVEMLKSIAAGKRPKKTVYKGPLKRAAERCGLTS